MNRETDRALPRSCSRSLLRRARELSQPVWLAFVVFVLGFPAAGQESEVRSADTRVLGREEAVRLALANAAQYQQAQIEQSIAAADVRQARAALLPVVGASGLLTYNSPSSSSASPSFLGANAIREYQGLIMVNETLSFSLAASVQRARAALAAARAGTDLAWRQLILLTEQTYYSLSFSENQYRFAGENLQAAERFEAVTRSMLTAGEIPEADLNRARLQTESRRSELQQSMAARTAARESLQALIGEGERFTTTSLLDEIVVQPSSAAAETGETHPALQQLQAQRNAAAAELRIARGERLPSLTWTLARGFDSDSLQSSALRQHRGMLATAGVSWSLIDWGASAARQAQARLRVRSLEVQAEQVRRNLSGQLRSAVATLESAEARARLLLRAREDAERNVSTAEARYRAGEGSILEVTDAQNLLVAQRTSLYTAAFDYAVARSQIEALRVPRERP